MGKITWRKFLALALFSLPIAIANGLYCCSQTPRADSITPDYGFQGTDFDVAITGSHFVDCDPAGFPHIWIDGFLCGTHGGTDGVQGCDPQGWTDTYVPVHLTVAGTARLGVHTVAVATDNGGVTSPLKFTVTCPGCPPPPILWNVESRFGEKLVPGAPAPGPAPVAVSFQFSGQDLNHNPQVQIAGPGISFPPDPITVQNISGTDIFFLDITADATATSGMHDVTVTTAGGTSATLEIEVDASQPSPNASPGPTPDLRSITPMQIGNISNNQGQISIKAEGSGFGTRHDIILENAAGFYRDAGVEATYQADPDKVAVVIAQIIDTLPDSCLTVHIHSIDNNTDSDRLVLCLNPINQNAPLVTGVSGVLNRGGDADVIFIGENLRNVTPLSFTGIRGLTFSNFQALLNIPPDNGFQAHVHSDFTTPISGDEATNLVLTTSQGSSPPFFFRIFPPLPP